MISARITTPPTTIPAMTASFVVESDDEGLGPINEPVDVLLADADRGGPGEKVGDGGVCEEIALGGGGEMACGGGGGEGVTDGGGGEVLGGGDGAEAAGGGEV